MTHSPQAYPVLVDGRYWATIYTPSGLRAMLRTSYNTQGACERAIQTMGYRLIAQPKHEDIDP